MHFLKSCHNWVSFNFDLILLIYRDAIDKGMKNIQFLFMYTLHVHIRNLASVLGPGFFSKHMQKGIGGYIKQLK